MPDSDSPAAIKVIPMDVGSAILLFFQPNEDL